MADVATLSPTNHTYLAFLQDIHDVSAACGTTTYIWGGWTTDLLAGRCLREHHDLDGFTRDLLQVLPEMLRLYADRGYAARFRDDFHMLVIERDGLHAAFNRLEIDGALAMWRHIGEQGTVFFPAAWLDESPRYLCGVPVYAAGAQLDYAIKANVRLLSPEWRLRERDRDALEWLSHYLDEQGVDREAILESVWSVNPFWAKRGYPEYVGPARDAKGG